jgi:transcriptional regulator with XRE-family HTH domain
MEPFKTAIKAYRIKHGKTGLEMAEIFQVSPAAYSHYESGFRVPKPEKVRDLEKALNYELTRFQMRPDVYGDSPEDGLQAWVKHQL